ncbi:protein-tyrosine phosphatase [Pullulanibacillus pueri]|uniref:protein-tyrosine-phosphatase n=1 Tax=Pullulanibacillus pueri TaxID=1437324 RepID=A0A8J3ELX2_9BACL|nr:low molecular weight protein-tyrosine-phosphatase [Pullulanibacillus pueri]MBM7680741.1 protein-tyrosine phosphatase [Pullulanibacillus pueri]GGH78162.1 phosphotyrosine protein phosphatase [Pullulanibacillus pueri]
MIRVVFVCLGNICRSPMAEALFRHKITQMGLHERIAADSAGTGDWHLGNPPHQRTQDILLKHGISIDNMEARLFTLKDAQAYDYIVAMDKGNIEAIKKLIPESLNKKVFRLLDFLPGQSLRDIPDPYYSGNFEQVYNLVDEGTNALIDYICQENHIHLDNMKKGE